MFKKCVLVAMLAVSSSIIASEGVMFDENSQLPILCTTGIEATLGSFDFMDFEKTLSGTSSLDDSSVRMSTLTNIDGSYVIMLEYSLTDKICILDFGTIN